jgi:hypothetical protein
MGRRLAARQINTCCNTLGDAFRIELRGTSIETRRWAIIIPLERDAATL